MTLLSLAQLREEIQVRARRIGAPVHTLPSLGGPQAELHPGLSVAEDGYHLQRTERGRLVEDLHTTDADELLYWIFVDVTRQLTATPAAGETWQARSAAQLALLGRLEPRWAQRHAAVLAQQG